MLPEQRPFQRRPEKLTMHPRRVRGGTRLSRKDSELAASWAAQRVIRLIEAGVAGEALREGLEYARLGQAKAFTMGPGRIDAIIQGRAERPYQTKLHLPVIGPEGWEQAVAAMAEQASYSARLLGGEVPSNIEDAFAPSGLRLFPASLDELTSACSCGHATSWCKHAACAAYLLADRLAGDSLLMFELRGIGRADLIDRLRAGRSVAPPGVEAPVYIPTAHGDGAVPLSECIDRFWEAGPELDLVDLPVEPPQVSHALLRRLGPSPFPESRFPLVGLLATCYDVVSRHTLEGIDAEPPAGEQGLDDAAGDDASSDDADGDDTSSPDDDQASGPDR